VYAQDPREGVTARGKLSALRRLVGHSLSENGQVDFVQALYECSACGQCHVVCPVRINTHELWEQARQSLAGAGIPQPEDQVRQITMIKEFNNSFGKPQQERGLWASLAWEAGLLTAPLKLWREHTAPMLYFAGCTASFDPAVQSVAVQSARLLQEAGLDFSILGGDEPCCASKLRRMGDIDFTAEAQKRMLQITGLGVRTVVVSCAGCYKGLHSDYRRLWTGPQEVLHLTQLIDLLIREDRLRLKHEVPMVITYHDPCHLGRHNQIYDAPRRILQAIPGLKLVEMPRHRAFSSCCGMGGGLKVVNPEIQHKMAGARIREAESTGAEAVVTPCQTCYLGLVNGVEETASSMRVYHLNEMLVRSVCPDVKHEEVKAAFESLASRAPAPKTPP
jgi:heterodisulfide reductase subunit D